MIINIINIINLMTIWLLLLLKINLKVFFFLVFSFGIKIRTKELIPNANMFSPVIFITFYY